MAGERAEERTLVCHWWQDEQGGLYAIPGANARGEPGPRGLPLPYDRAAAPGRAPQGRRDWPGASRSAGVARRGRPGGWVHRTELMVALQHRTRGLPAVEGRASAATPVAADWDHSACHAGMESA